MDHAGGYRRHRRPHLPAALVRRRHGTDDARRRGTTGARLHGGDDGQHARYAFGPARPGRAAQLLGDVVPALPLRTAKGAERNRRPFRRPAVRLPARIAGGGARDRRGVPPAQRPCLPERSRPRTDGLRALRHELHSAQLPHRPRGTHRRQLHRLHARSWSVRSKTN